MAEHSAEKDAAGGALPRGPLQPGPAFRAGSGVPEAQAQTTVPASPSAENDARREGSWCYRITREQHDGEDFYTIREVYTGKDGALSWTAEPIAARGDTWMECADDLAVMGRAIGSAVLDLTLDPPALVAPSDLSRRRVIPPEQRRWQPPDRQNDPTVDPARPDA